MPYKLLLKAAVSSQWTAVLFSELQFPMFKVAVSSQCIAVLFSELLFPMLRLLFHLSGLLFYILN